MRLLTVGLGDLCSFLLRMASMQQADHTGQPDVQESSLVPSAGPGEPPLYSLCSVTDSICRALNRCFRDAKEK